MKKFRRIFPVFLAVLLIMAQANGIGASAAQVLPSAYINGYSVTSSVILPNTTASFTFVIEKGSHTINNVKLKMDESGSFQFSDSSIIKEYSVSGNSIGPVSLLYSGADKKMSFTLYYDSDANGSYDAEYEQTLNISQASVSQTVVPPAHDPDDFKPDLTISGEVPSFSAGVKGTLKFTIQNKSGYDAKAITAVISSQDPVFMPTGVSGINEMGDVTANSSKEISLSLTPLSEVATGYYTISMAVEYKNTYGDKYTMTQALAVYITGKSGTISGVPSLRVVSAVQDKMTPGSDNLIKLTVSVSNVGTGKTGLATVSLEGYTSDGFSPDTAVSGANFDGIAAGQSVAASFGLKVSQKMVSGNYPMTVNIKYKDAKGEDQTVSETVYINLVRYTADSGVRVSAAKLNKNTPGKDKVLSLTVGLVNSGAAALSNVDVSLEGLSSTAISLHNMVGSKIVPTIALKGSASVTFPLYIAPALTTGNYDIKIKVKYTDISGNVAETTTDAFLYIYKPAAATPEDPSATGTPRIIISQYNTSASLIKAGEEFTFSFTLLNTSKTTALTNIKVNVSSGDGVFMPTKGTSSFFIENIAAGGSSGMSVSLSAKRDAETKSYPLTVSVDYEDKAAKPYSVSESVSLPVTQPQRLEVSNFQYYAAGMTPANINLQYINKGKAALYNLSIHVDGPFMSQNGDLFVGNFGASSMDYFDDMLTPTETGELKGRIIFSYEDVNGTQSQYVHEFTASVFDDMPIDPGIIEPDPGKPIDGGEETGGNKKLFMIIGIAAGAVLLIAGVVILIIFLRRKKMKAIDEDE